MGPYWSIGFGFQFRIFFLGLTLLFMDWTGFLLLDSMKKSKTRRLRLRRGLLRTRLGLRSGILRWLAGFQRGGKEGTIGRTVGTVALEGIITEGGELTVALEGIITEGGELTVAVVIVVVEMSAAALVVMVLLMVHLQCITIDFSSQLFFFLRICLDVEGMIDFSFECSCE
jgi:hypothetical protein